MTDSNWQEQRSNVLGNLKGWAQASDQAVAEMDEVMLDLADQQPASARLMADKALSATVPEFAAASTAYFAAARGLDDLNAATKAGERGFVQRIRDTFTIATLQSQKDKAGEIRDGWRNGLMAVYDGLAGGSLDRADPRLAEAVEFHQRLMNAERMQETNRMIDAGRIGTERSNAAAAGAKFRETARLVAEAPEGTPLPSIPDPEGQTALTGYGGFTRNFESARASALLGAQALTEARDAAKPAAAAPSERAEAGVKPKSRGMGV